MNKPPALLIKTLVFAALLASWSTNLWGRNDEDLVKDVPPAAMADPGGESVTEVLQPTPVPTDIPAPVPAPTATQAPPKAPKAWVVVKPPVSGLLEQG